jgi:hypothetical protein
MALTPDLVISHLKAALQSHAAAVFAKTAEAVGSIESMTKVYPR